MSSKKYQDLIKSKQDKLEKVRREREQLQIDKNARAVEKLKEKSTGNIETLEDLDKVCMTFGIPPVSGTELVVPKPPEQHQVTSNSTQPLPDLSIGRESAISKKLLKLSVSSTKSTDIQPERKFTYTKSTQTNISRVPLSIVIPKFTENDDEDMSEGGFVSKLPPGCMSPGLPQLHFVEPAITILDNISEECSPVQELTEDQKQTIISSKNFQTTVLRLGRVMENVVSRNVDISKDYIRGIDYEDEADAKARGQVSLNRTMYDDQWSKNRCVTSMDWSTYYPEMIVASYHINENEPLEPDGIVIVWNTKSKIQTPEYVFHSPSAVISTCFAKFNPNLILGGTYSGQIVLWDNRSPKPIPVQSTTLNCGGHIQPIHTMQMIGNESSHNIISISSDGKLCSWSLDMLSEPVDTLTLEKAQKRPVASTCMAFLANESNNVLVGSEDGCTYFASRFGFNAGIKSKFESHEAPVTGISTHSCDLSSEFEHLFLTSSIDCSIKLWSLNNQEPLHTFNDNYDYVMDVAWSSIHPAVFAAVDGSGRLDLWNLNMDTQAPTASVVVNGQPALNRIIWSPNGQHIGVGDVDGKIFLYDIVERLAQPLPGECSVFGNTIKSF